MRIRIQCHSCGLPYRATIAKPPESLECPNCADRVDVATEGWQNGPDYSVEHCPICGCKHLYRQRDFNRALGCLLVAIGAALVPWTYGLSLIVLSAVDYWFYKRLSPSVVCYRCDTVFRDAKPSSRQGEFDLLKHDVLKYGKSWEPNE